MTRQRDIIHSPGSLRTRAALDGRDNTPLSPLATPTEQERSTVTSSRSSTAGNVSPRVSGHRPASYEPGSRKTLFQKEGVPYGTTRYAAVFSENHASFGPAMLDVAEDRVDGGLRVSSSGSHQANRGFDVGQSRRELAINTMLEFPSLGTCELLTNNIPEMYDVWLSPTMIRQCLRQVWTEYGGCLGRERSRESVSTMVDDIFDNGRRPLSRPDTGGMNDENWVNWFGGPRLRWEMIGILFTWAGMAFRHKQEWDRVFELPEQQGMTRKTAAENMRVCANNCLRLCDDFLEVNDIIVVLMKNCGKLRSNIISDESDHLRMDFGTTGAAFITAGLHRLPVSSQVTPLSQYRSIISTSFFHLDKSESLFNGRPPMLAKRFCYIPAPLDLCEDDVYNGPDRLAEAVKRLDGNGWNTDNQIYATTWLRAVSLLSPIREEILGLSLTAHLQYTKSQVDALVTQLEQIISTYPAHIRYHPISQQPASQKRVPHEVYLITRIQLDVLQCAFLLQRLLVSGGYSNGQDLFNVAKEMISVVLACWSERELLTDYNYAFDWLILSYGIPCAGILCLELLRASHLAPPMAATSTIPSPSPVRMSKSDVVQTLSLFIAFLDWIRPTDNNAQLCAKFKKVVKRIIDTAIDAPRSSYTALGPAPLPNPRDPPTAGPALSSRYLQLQLPPLPPCDSLAGSNFLHEFDPASLAMDDLDWLNTVDWTQGDWLELSQQNFP
ncbi:FAD dependent oxidoreductase superfamily [Diplocarpon rosae]|nr:FAD dependent oxidoreductase superfamily [Diplocarpon rosae]